jgi:cation diffusion facilitator CzcD-associated flavoprotein CzcO
MGTGKNHVDVLIVGAGLSGIGMACHLTRECPTKSYTILEARGAIGGTWDLFRFPGIRSDSDMYTLGYEFKPWASDMIIADGPSIKGYVEETADEYDVTRHIEFHHRVTGASWDSDTSMWTVEVAVTDPDAGAVSPSTYTCHWLQMCSGYYSYVQGHRPDFPNEDAFAGRIVHPQEWPDDLQSAEDLAGKKVVVIGSGATAVTLVPALAEKGARVTMLQRSPTWIFPAPAQNPIMRGIRKALPERTAYSTIRFINAARTERVYRISRKHPEKLKRFINKQVEKELGGALPLDPHFTPAYNPWDQRLCLSPDADIFAAIRDGSATVVTDTIDTFTEDGIGTSSGQTLEADIIVTATGLELLALAGITPVVDGKRIDLADCFTYKGFMYSDVPNLGTTFGYINASWTLRADLIAKYVCRVIEHLDDSDMERAVPRLPDREMPRRPYVDDFSSGYMQRNLHLYPKQSDSAPWIASQSYAYDKKVLLGPKSEIADGVMEFSAPVRAEAQVAESEPVPVAGT